MKKDKILDLIEDIMTSNLNKKDKLIGVEFEHFIINKKTFESYDYKSGVLEIMNKLLNKGWKKIDTYSNENLSLKKGYNTITLEPGGQIEISLKPLKKLKDIRLNYLDILSDIKTSLNEYQEIVSLGYHPKSKIESLEILPKDRYYKMFEYFKSCGIYAHNMMKGTASTQVSIDYKSKEDFFKKFRVANFLSPFIYRIFDSSPIFEGDIYKNNNLRLDIWDNTDKSRCGIINGSLDKKDFNFKDYANYILNTPPIFIKKGDIFNYTGKETLKSLIQSWELDKKDIEYVLGMVFPDVRVKNYIEIRMADAIPYPLNMAVAAFVKGIFYNQGNLDKYFKMSYNYSERDLIDIKELFKKSLNFDYNGVNIKDLVNEMLDDSIKALNKDENKELVVLKRLIEKHGSVSNWLKEIYKFNSEDFLKIISGGDYFEGK